MVGRLMLTIDVSSVAIKMPTARIANTTHLLGCSCSSPLLGIVSLSTRRVSLFPCTLEVPADRFELTIPVFLCFMSVRFLSAVSLYHTLVDYSLWEFLYFYLLFY